MSRDTGWSLISPVSLAVPEQPVDMAPEDQRKFQNIYTSLYTLVGALRDYAGIGNWSKAHIESLAVGATCYAGLQNRVFLEAAESIETNDIVEINSAGKVIKSMSSNVCGMMIGKNVTTGNKCEVMLLFGIVKNFTGLTPGSKYYVGGVPGKLSTGGTIPVAVAISSSALFLNIKL